MCTPNLLLSLPKIQIGLDHEAERRVSSSTQELWGAVVRALRAKVKEAVGC